MVAPAHLRIDSKNPEFDEESMKKVVKIEQEYARVAKDFGCKFLRASDYVKDIGFL